MTDLTEAPMPEFKDEGSSGKSVIWMMLAGFGIIMTTGAIGGFSAKSIAARDWTSWR